MKDIYLDGYEVCRLKHVENKERPYMSVEFEEALEKLHDTLKIEDKDVRGYFTRHILTFLDSHQIPH